MSPDDTASGTLSAAATEAREALDEAKAEVERLKTKVADAASALASQGRDLAGGDSVRAAADELAGAIRRNPLAAVGVAFTAGLVLALLTRG